MIDFLKGILVEKTPTRIVLDVNNIGYEVFVTLNCYDSLPAPKETVLVWTYDYVREDQHLLYGFVSKQERHMFTLLVGVTGIGPRTAMSILSGLASAELAEAIRSGDNLRLTGISGVGRKTAERLVVELKDKLKDLELPGVSFMPSKDDRVQDGVRALMALGYKTTEAHKMIASASGKLKDTDTLEDLIRNALRR